jgi:hypothetical protein
MLHEVLEQTRFPRTTRVAAPGVVPIPSDPDVV